MQNLLRYFIVSLCIFLITIFFGLNSVSATQASADELTLVGHKLLEQGQPNSALKTWEKALELYRTQKNQEGISGTLINESLALQKLGYIPRACEKAAESLDINTQICNRTGFNATSKVSKNNLLSQRGEEFSSNLKMTGLQSLGEALRKIGKLDQSKIALENAIKLGVQTRENISFLRLSLANTEHSIFLKDKEKPILSDDDISKKLAIVSTIGKAKMTYDLYSEIIKQEQQNSKVGLKSRINLLELLINFDEWKNSISKIHDFTDDNIPFDIEETQSLILQIQNSDFTALDPIDTIYSRLNYSESLLKIVNKPNLKFVPQKHPLTIAFDQSILALNEAEQIQNQRAKSYAQGSLGKLYSKSGQTNLAIKTFENAKILANKIQAPEISFRWNAELGKLYALANNTSKANESFEESIQDLDIVRRNLFSIPSEILFSFTDDIEPVYQKYLDFLLTDSHDINKALQVNDQLHIAKIENFLGCNKLDLISLSNGKSLDLPPLIYTLSLGKTIEVVLRNPDGSIHQHSANQKNVLENINHLQNYLQNDNFWEQDESTFLPYLQSLYNEIIKPMREYLPNTSTLVFSPDESLQSIPLSLLHDGKSYLNEYFSIANSTGAESSKRIPSNKEGKVLIGALSKSSPSFSESYAPKNLQPLPQVLREIDEIKKYTNIDQSLLDEKFTVKNFQNAVTKSKFSTIHLTTHGQFSSDPKKTVLLAWDRVINVTEIDQLLKSSLENYSFLDLLVLSACQTAKGDSKSALGIAGIATQAGAKSVVASLWQPDAEASILFMREFYKDLQNNKTKVESLRLAQKVLRDNTKYGHPYYWAPFVLVGDWN